MLECTLTSLLFISLSMHAFSRCRHALLRCFVIHVSLSSTVTYDDTGQLSSSAADSFPLLVTFATSRPIVKVICQSHMSHDEINGRHLTRNETIMYSVAPFVLSSAF